MRSRLRICRHVRPRAVRLHRAGRHLQQPVCRHGHQPQQLRRLRAAVRAGRELRGGPMQLRRRSDGVWAGVSRHEVGPAELRRLRTAVRRERILQRRELSVPSGLPRLQWHVPRGEERSLQLRRVRQAVRAGGALCRRRVPDDEPMSTRSRWLSIWPRADRLRRPRHLAASLRRLRRRLCVERSVRERQLRAVFPSVGLQHVSVRERLRRGQPAPVLRSHRTIDAAHLRRRERLPLRRGAPSAWGWGPAHPGDDRVFAGVQRARVTRG